MSAVLSIVLLVMVVIAVRVLIKVSSLILEFQDIDFMALHSIYRKTAS